MTSARYRAALPQTTGSLFLTDGGIETTLIFDDGFELPDFAAFTLLGDADGRAALVRYFESYLAIARRDAVGIVLETPTWRASADWAARLGFSLDELVKVNHDAVGMLADLRQQYETETTPVVISGCVGPRGDGYQPGDLFTEWTRRNVADFQRATADLRDDPDGYPGPLTWTLLHIPTGCTPR